MFNKAIFSKRLKILKQIKGLTSKDIAMGIDVSEPALSQFLSEKSTPSLDNLIKLADYLNVSIDYLVGRSDDFNCKDDMATEEMSVTINKDFELGKKIKFNLDDVVFEVHLRKIM